MGSGIEMVKFSDDIAKERFSDLFGSPKEGGRVERYWTYATLERIRLRNMPTPNILFILEKMSKSPCWVYSIIEFPCVFVEDYFDKPPSEWVGFTWSEAVRAVLNEELRTRGR